MSNESNRDLTGAYSLHALTEAERAEFESYLAGADDVRAEATELSDTAVYLGLAAQPEMPSAALKARLMAQLDSTPQLAAEPTAVEESASVAAVTALPSPSARHSASTRTAQRRAENRWFTRPVTLLASAAAAVALIVGGGVVVRGTIVDQQNQQQQAAAIHALYSAPDAKLATAKVAGGGTATVVSSASQKKSAVEVKNLKGLSAQRVYELWYIDGDGQATPAGLMPQGAQNASMMLEGSYWSGATVGITVEPKGGSKHPTTDPVAVVATA